MKHAPMERIALRIMYPWVGRSRPASVLPLSIPEKPLSLGPCSNCTKSGGKLPLSLPARVRLGGEGAWPRAGW
ncbi:hypothetical protein GMSM_33700 [Geomonas sp. Red276]